MEAKSKNEKKLGPLCRHLSRPHSLLCVHRFVGVSHFPLKVFYFKCSAGWVGGSFPADPAGWAALMDAASAGGKCRNVPSLTSHLLYEHLRGSVRLRQR